MTLVKSNLYRRDMTADLSNAPKTPFEQTQHAETLQITAALLEKGNNLKPVSVGTRKSDYLRYVMMGIETQSFIFQQIFPAKGKADGIFTVDDDAFQVKIGKKSNVTFTKIEQSGVKEVSTLFHDNWQELLAHRNGKPVIGLLVAENFQTSEKIAPVLDVMRGHLLKNKVVDIPTNKK